MRIEVFVNEPLDSNCYVLEYDSHAIVVDPGCADVSLVADYIAQHALVVDYIILTHEHIDHVQGVKRLTEQFGAEVIASAECFEALADPCLNLSAEYPGVEPQNYLPDRIITIDSLGGHLVWNGVEFRFFVTRGHSAGSICIATSDVLFSGDTLLEKIKTYTTAPNSSIVELRDSLLIIKNTFSPTQIVYPGHGIPFTLKDVEPFIDAQMRLLDRKIARLQKK